MAAKSRPTQGQDRPAAGMSVSELIGVNSDVEALVYTTLMDATKDAQADIKAVMDGVKAINAAKRRLRELLGKIRRDVVAATVSELEGNGVAFSPRGLGGERAYHHVEIPVPDAESRGGFQVAVISLVDDKIVSKAQLEAAADAIRNELDSMSELGEMESLRLQMAMDRMSKFMSALSNLLKKVSDTSEGIIDNLK